MDNLLLYLFKAAIGTTFLYLIYLLFFSMDTFYNRNRFLLLLILIIPMIVPLLGIVFSRGIADTGVYVKTINNIVASGNNADSAITNEIHLFTLMNVVVWFYFSVAAFIIIRLITGIVKTFEIIKKGGRINDEFPYVIETESDYPPFSFFPYIVIPKNIYNSNNGNDILEHEKAHIRQLHSFDLFFCELVTAFQWFNPAIWLVRRNIIRNHEFLADHASIEYSHNIKEYQYRLLNIPVRQNLVPVTHNFSSSIKNRLVMINKKPTPKIARLKNFLFLPAVAILFMMFAFTMSNQEHQLSKQSSDEIAKYLMQNIVYPETAKIFQDTGTVYVSVKVDKDGIIKEPKAFRDKNQIKSELLQEIVIVAYRPTPPKVKTPVVKDPTALETECIKWVSKIGTQNIPEWKEKSCELTFAFKFALR